jgi:hypothetical protein
LVVSKKSSIFAADLIKYINMLVEPAPSFSPSEAGAIGQQAFTLLANPEIQLLIKRINNEYLYWDKAKYLCPKEIDQTVFWTAIKFLRIARIQTLQFGQYTFSYSTTDKMHALLNQFDMNFGGMLNSASIIPEQDKQMYLVSSIMEEAIASSQMEGANTTRKVAKEMLRKQQTPVNKDQQMILNNYETIRYISEHKNDEFSVPNIKIIHSYSFVIIVVLLGSIILSSNIISPIPSASILPLIGFFIESIFELIIASTFLHNSKERSVFNNLQLIILMPSIYHIPWLESIVQLINVIFLEFQPRYSPIIIES